jgi:hypothetical protein
VTRGLSHIASSFENAAIEKLGLPGKFIWTGGIQSS